MSAREPGGRPGRLARLRLAGVVDLNSFRRQLVLSTAAFSAVVAIGLVLAVQLLLSGSALASVDRLLGDRATVLIGSIDGATTSHTLVVPDADVDPGVAVYDSDGVLVAGYVPPHQARMFAELSTTHTQRDRRLGDAFALVGRPFATKSGASGVIVLSERIAPFEDEKQDALQVSIFAGVVLFLVATGLAAWASRRALAPVAQMARTAESWSEHDLDRRFDLGPPTNEIRALGQTLDGLLEKVERTIVAEQRLTSELAHELRTPLTAVHGTAELMTMRPDLDAELREDVAEILVSCRHMAETITSLLELARSQSSAHTGEVCEMGAVLDGIRASLDHEHQVSVVLDGDFVVAMPGDLAARTLSPVVDNAIRHAQHVTVGCRRDARHVVVTVSDDGPGVARADADRIFRAGETDGGGSGLGLALARRVARSVGGDVVLLPVGDDRRGASFEVRLPSA